MIYDFTCPRGHKHEHFLHSSKEPDPLCDDCGAPTERSTFNRFAVVFTGPLTKKYLTPGMEGYNQAESGAHWAYETKNLDGSPKQATPVMIENFQQQKEFCKREGLINPTMSGRAEINSTDGKSVNGSGLPGCEV